MIYLDTHVVVWLYQNRTDLFTDRVRELLEQEELQVSPAVLLELEYLFEIEKIKHRGREILEYLENRLDLLISLEPFIHVVREACAIKWTRDPFDKLIVSQAAIRKNILITKDKNIRTYYPEAVW